MAKIIIIDDRPMCREFLIKLLTYKHHELIEADNGEQALDIIKNSKPDLIITDLLMPTMNGYEFVQEIKSIPDLANIPVIFYTASFLLDEAKLLADSCAVNHVLFKPCDPQLILDTVEEALNSNTKSSQERPETTSPPMSEVVTKISSSYGSGQLGDHLIKIQSKTVEINRVIHFLQSIGESGEQELKIALDLLDIFEQQNNYLNQLAAMTQLTHKLLSEREPKHLLQIFTENVCSILFSEYCSVIIFSNSSNQKTIKQIVTYNNNSLVEPEINHALLDTPLIQKTITSDQVVTAENLESDTKKMFPKNHPLVHHFIGARIITPSHLYGVVYLANKIDQSTYSEFDRQIITTLSAELAMLYENLDLYATIQSHAAQLLIKSQ